MLDALAHLMIVVLRSLEGVTHSYGMAIVLFAVLMKLVLYYPTKQQYQAMRDMQKIQPELARIQEEFKGDQQLSQQKQMELMRQHNVNPMAGCLPMVIQMPILFAIWRAIMMDQHLFESSYSCGFIRARCRGIFPSIWLPAWQGGICP